MRKLVGLKRTGGLKSTSLKRVSEKKKSEDPQIKKDQQDKDREFYMSIWNERGPKCESCDCPLFTNEPTSANMDHLMPKSKFPELRYEKENILVVCLACHTNREGGFPRPRHLEAIERAKIRFNK